jgi:FtsZ-interacting cell division protein YlmF
MASVAMPVPINSGQLASSVPYVQPREAVVVEQQRMANEHTRRMFDFSR